MRIVVAMILLIVGLPNTAAADCPRPDPLPRTAQAIPLRPDIAARLNTLMEQIQEGARAWSYPVLAFGDSNMGGWPYEGITAAMERPVLKASLGGGGTQTVLWQLATMDWSRQSPNFVVLLVGANDLGFPVCDVYWGIREDIAKVHEKFPAATVIYIGILPRGDDMRMAEDKIDAVNSLVRAAAASGTFLFLDAHDDFICDHHTPCPLYKPDNLHLSRQGFELLGERLHRLVRQPPN